MNRPSGPGKTASNLPESIHQRLNLYALATGAAGVSVLALVHASEAKIVYTPANVGISPRFNSHYHLDLNQDGITVISASSGLCGKDCFFKELRVAPAQRDGVEINQSGVAALSYGARIGETRGFHSRTATMFRTSWRTFGYYFFGRVALASAWSQARGAAQLLSTGQLRAQRTSCRGWHRRRAGSILPITSAPQETL